MKASTLVASLILVATTLISVPMAASADSMPTDPGNVLTPTTVTADALPTVQIDGVVWSQVIVGNTVFAGGNFATARPAGAAAGTNTVPRKNLLAYSLDTGELISGFVADFNGQVTALAASPDGSRLYVGGEFTQLNGEPASRLVALDPTSGARITGFDPKPSNAVRAIVATPTTVYFAGAFFNVGTAGRNEIAAVRATDGALFAWRPVIEGGKVNALALAPGGDKIAVGGEFTSVNGSAENGYGLAVIDTATAQKLPYAASAYVKNGGTNGAITTLGADGEAFYAGGYTFGRTSTLEGIVAVKWNDLTTKWLEDCHGDTYSVHPAEGAVYLAGHPHYCGNVGGFPQEDSWDFNRALSFSKATAGTISREIHGYTNFEGLPRPDLQNWFPSISAGTFTGQDQGPWNVTGNSEYVVYGGEFARVNFKDQQGLVRFAVKAKAPNLRGPINFADSFVPTVTSPDSGVVRVRWQANYDLDNKSLTYKVVRDGNTAQPIHTFTADSTFWLRQGMVFFDKGLEPGSTHSYRIFATDPTGRESRGSAVNVVVSGTAPAPSTYRSIIVADQPQSYWRLDESAAANGLVDSSGADDLQAQGNVSMGQNGSLAGDSNKAVTLAGNQLFNPTRQKRTDSFSLELWFKASGLQRGRLMGYGSATTGSSAKSDRLLYLNNQGQLYFGVQERGTKRTVNGTRNYTDNRWHHAVATLGNNGMNLFVDGALVASRATTKTALEMEGYWRIGGDSLSGWSSAPSSANFAGGIDEVAVYGAPLDASQVLNHYRAGTGAASNISPTAAFNATVSHLDVAFDAAESSDAEGPIASYAWDFGDGSTGSGVAPTHSYSTAGNYTVILTVTDANGLKGTRTASVVTTAPPAPNEPPIAEFGIAVNGAVASFSALDSSDPDGSVASYGWDFGDGETGTGVEVVHTYAQSGSYDVKLTVKDNNDATDTSTKRVTVEVPILKAKDLFDRTVTGGWGSADVGGSWTRTGTAATTYVDQGAGHLLAVNPGSGPAAYLGSVSQTDSDVRVEIGLDKDATGGGTYVSLSPRYISAANQYQLKARISSNGSVLVQPTKIVGGTESILASVTIPNLTYHAGDTLNLRAKVSGTFPTSISVKVWDIKQSEPVAWSAATTDSESTLQVAGGIGTRLYLSGSSTNAPVTAHFDNLRSESE